MQQTRDHFSASLSLCVRAVSTAVEMIAARMVAAVHDADGATDIAIELPGASLALLRCVQRIRSGDCTTLETMISEGDFVWAGLVYSDHEGTDWPENIEAFHFSDACRLILRLRAIPHANS